MMKSYLKNETAAASIETVVLVVVALVVAIAVGWWVFNIVKSQATKSKCSSGGSPFCVE